MKQTSLTLVFLFLYCTVMAQVVTARVVSKENGKPIAYASIKIDENSGVISNDEGFFTIKHQARPVTISCMGFQNKTLTTNDIKELNFIIELSEATNQLSEVYISNKTPNADSIMAQVIRHIPRNYDYLLNRHRIFKRNSDYAHFENLEFEIEKATHVSKKNIEKANTDLRALSKQVRESRMVHFTDFMGEFYALKPDSSKLKVEKATKLIDYKNDFSIEDIQKKAQNIVLTYIDTTKTYKVKTGIFKIEDSLALNDDEFKNENQNKFNLSHLNNETRDLLRKSQFLEASFLSNITNSKLYEYTLEDTTFSNNELTYQIRFEPRRAKSKYSGTIYVSDSTFAITRLDYGYHKNRHGGKFNLKLLLGVKYMANLSEGTILFEKNANKDVYQPKYIKHTSGSFFYLSRGLKFIENGPTKNKVGFSFKIEGSNTSKVELLFTKNNKLTLSDFEAINQEKEGTYQILNRFDKTLWESNENLEPLKEMKTFSNSSEFTE